jgi:uncharacterized secreted protein with C-terminal beta-propeller domain
MCSNPKNPIEKSKYTLTDSWTEVNSNHHAFLKDEKHKAKEILGGENLSNEIKQRIFKINEETLKHYFNKKMI